MLNFVVIRNIHFIIIFHSCLCVCDRNSQHTKTGANLATVSQSDSQSVQKQMTSSEGQKYEYAPLNWGEGEAEY